jgi:hypothetical protein
MSRLDSDSGTADDSLRLANGILDNQLAEWDDSLGKYPEAVQSTILSMLHPRIIPSYMRWDVVIPFLVIQLCARKRKKGERENLYVLTGLGNHAIRFPMPQSMVMEACPMVRMVDFQPTNCHLFLF